MSGGKVIPIALASHYGQPTTTTAHALKITRTDGQVFAFTSAGQDVTLAGQLYSAAQGLLVTGIDTSAGFEVDNLELTTIDDGSLFTNILAGTWRGAAFLLMRYNWASPTDGVEYLLAGTFGEMPMNRNTITIELRGLQQVLQLTIGAPSQKLCRYRVGVNDGYLSRCPVDIAAYTFTGTLTSVTSLQVMRASALGKPLDYFTEGELTFTSGANDGRTIKVKAFAADGTFTFALPLQEAAAIGDTFTASAGCTKRWAEDCDAKFGAALDFGGEPHRPGVDQLTSAPDQEAS